MTYKEIKDLLRHINNLELTEFKLEQPDFKLAVRTKGYSKHVVTTSEAPSVVYSAAPPAAAAPVAPAPVAAAAPAPAAAADQPAAEDTSNLLEIKSPMVGTFYRSASPDKPPYVKVGDSISSGDTVCIVEAMKLFNDIESEVSGKIVKVLLEDASPVEYDQVLFLVDPNG